MENHATSSSEEEDNDNNCHGDIKSGLSLSHLLLTEPSPIHSTEIFTELKHLEENWSIIETEIPPFELSNVKHTRPEFGFSDEYGREFLKNVGRCEWIGGDKNADRWFNFPILHNNQFVFDIEHIMPKTCDVIRAIRDKVAFEIIGLCVLVGGSLDIHTDMVGPDNDSMAANMLLRGKGSLSIQSRFDEFTFIENHLSAGKFCVFNS
jgi:hypothetical protein